MRKLGRLIGRIAAVLGLLILGMQPVRTYAATFTVTRTDDPMPNGCAVDDCSLREAIIAANAASNADTIVLPSGIYTLTLAGPDENSSATGDLDITSAVTINASGPTSPVVEANNLDRVFDLIDPTFNGISVQINGVVLQGGNVADSGGGVYVHTSTELTLTNSIVRNNISTNNDGGGGIYIQGTATLTLQNSSIVNNVANSISGGGIKNNGTLTAINSTISGNSTIGSGGGIFNNNTATLNNVTVVNNRANNAGGVSAAPGTTLLFSNSLLAGNRNDSNQPSDCGGTLESQGYNLVQSTTNCTITGTTLGNILNQEAKIGPLASNGGSTPTHALLGGSPALNAGNPLAPGSGGNACAATDQRGVARPLGSRCDIGAFEGVVIRMYLPLVIK